MNQISDLPGDTLAGTTFNYMVWTPNTDVLLCSVPWNSDYRDIVKFDNQLAIDTYLEQNAGPHIIFNQLTFARPGMPVRISLPYDQCYAFNYLRVRNNAAPVSLGGKTFYYFVTDVRYVAPNTTELMVQLDVWQSFGRDVTFGNCYVERGHVGIADSNSTRDQGRYSLTVPEGLDVGNEYRIIDNWNHIIAKASDANDPYDYDILMYSTTQLEGPWGDATAPILKTAYPSFFEGLPNGMACYWFPDRNAFTYFMGTVSSYPWIGQGIVGIYAVPPMSNLFNMTFSTGDVSDDGNLNRFLITGSSLYGYHITGGTIPEKVFTLADRYWRLRVMNAVGEPYKMLTKFCTYPYSVVEMTTYTGTPLMLKPECIPTDSIDVIQQTHLAIPGQKINFMPYRYNDGNDWDPIPYDHVSQGFGEDGAEFLDMATSISNFPMFSIVNNSYLGYLASNKNSIAYQHTSADWSQQRALQGADVQATQANMGIQAGGNAITSQRNQNVDTMQLGYDTANAQGLVGGGQAIVGAGIQGVGGNAPGMISSLVGGAATLANTSIQQNLILQQTGINNSGMQQRWMASRIQQEGVRDTNLEYAQYAAKGDYGNAIAAINAKVQDAKLIQPTTAGQVGGDAFLLAAYQWGVFAKVKLVSKNIVNQIGDFWLRYGYAVNRFVNMNRSDMNISVMTKFSYWKMKETYIISSGVPEGFRQTIRGIFEKGVTVWNDAHDVGTVSIYDNAPIGGITL